MPTPKEAANAGLIKNWQTLIGVATLIFSGGMFYAEQRSLRTSTNATEDKVNKQYETIRKQNESIIELQKYVEWEKGYNEAKKELSK